MRTCVSLAVLVVGSVLVSADDPLTELLDSRLSDAKPLSPIDTKAKGIAVVMPRTSDALKPIEIKTAEELAKSPLFNKASAEKVKKEVNFEKEYLVVFAWNGPRGDKLAGRQGTIGKASVADVRYTPGITFDRREHFYLFIVPNDTITSVSAIPAQLDENSDVKEIPTKDLKIAFPENPGGPGNPEIITSAAQLSRSPALNDAAEEIQKRVNFDKEKVVFLTWFGSFADRFTLEVKHSEGKFVLTFQVRAGFNVDRYKHARLFVVPKDIPVETTGGK